MSKVDELMGLVSKLESHSWNAGKNSALADIEGETGSQEPAWQAEQALTLGASLKAKLRTTLSTCVAEWLPISEAPRDGAVVELANAHGTWYAKWRPVYQSGFPATNPWFSLMLNHDHIAYEHRFDAPTHFRALTPPTTEAETEGETK